MRRYSFINTWFSFHSPHTQVIWICGLTFSVLAAILKVLFLLQFNPSLLWHMLSAFLVAVLFWYWLVIRRGRVTAVWTGSIGALIGLLTPPLTWLLYGVYLFFTTAEPVETFGWSLAYAWLMLIRVSPFSLVLGILVGMGMAYVQGVRTR